jgi:hypothetical protein
MHIPSTQDCQVDLETSQKGRWNLVCSTILPDRSWDMAQKRWMKCTFVAQYCQGNPELKHKKKGNEMHISSTKLLGVSRNMSHTKIEQNAHSKNDNILPGRFWAMKQKKGMKHKLAQNCQAEFKLWHRRRRLKCTLVAQNCQANPEKWYWYRKRWTKCTSVG